MEEMLIGVTDRSIVVFIPDSASTDGSGKTGLVAANLTVSYTRVETDNDVTVTDVTSSLNNLAALTDAHNDWGLLEVSSTLCPGLYRLDIADAVFAAGAWYAVVYVMVTTSAAAATPKAFRLVAVNALDAVRQGMTALPNAAADAPGGLPISDAGGLDLDAKVGALTFTVANKVDANATHISGDSGAADNAESFFDGTGYAGTNNVIPSVTTVTGNVAGTVGSVTGAVGSVVGNVGGNVTGSVGSVTGNVGGNVVGTVGGFSVAAKAEIESEVNDALVVHRLDELLNADSDIDGAAPPTVGSVFHELMSKTAGSFTYDQLTDSLEAIRDRGDAAWITATGFSTLTQAQVNAEVVDALATDTYAEPSAPPAATATLAAKIGWVCCVSRNKILETSTTQTLRNDVDSGNIATSAVSDDGTTFTRAKWV